MILQPVRTGLIDTVGATAASSIGTAINAGSANNKGSWGQIIASTTYEAHGLILVANHNNASTPTASNLIDVGVGGSGFEQVVVPDILLSNDQWHMKPGAMAVFPTPIPKGSRVAVRHQSTNGSDSMDFLVHLLSEPYFGFRCGKCVSIGTTTADSGGTAVDPGTSANTKGSYAQLIASTVEDLVGFMVCIGNQGSTKTSTANALLDIAIGGAAAEQVVLANMPVTCDSNSELYQPIWSPIIPCFIPAGSRIAARAQSSITTAGARVFDVALVGFTT